MQIFKTRDNLLCEFTTQYFGALGVLRLEAQSERVIPVRNFKSNHC